MWGLQAQGADPLKGQGEAQVPGFVAYFCSLKTKKIPASGWRFFHMYGAIWGRSCFLYCSHGNPLLTRREGRWGNGCLSLPPSFSVLTGQKVADGSQGAGLLSSGLRNLHLEEACLLVEHRPENISFHIPSPWSKVRPHWETFHDHGLFLSQGAGRLLPDQAKGRHWSATLGVSSQVRPIGRE